MASSPAAPWSPQYHQFIGLLPCMGFPLGTLGRLHQSKSQAILGGRDLKQTETRKQTKHQAHTGRQGGPGSVFNWPDTDNIQREQGRGLDMRQSPSPLACTTRRGPPFLPKRHRQDGTQKKTLRVLGTQAGKDANTTTRTSPFLDLVFKLPRVHQEPVTPARASSCFTHSPHDTPARWLTSF